MPTYEYRCEKCGQTFEKTMGLSQHAKQPKPSCPKCSSRKVEQLVSRFQAITNKKT
jgi:putative FmdB family regulatory protein